MAPDPVTIIKEYIQDYAIPPSHGDVDVTVIFVDEIGQYQLLQQGWNGPERVHSFIVHIEYRDDKVYVQHDGTEEGIGNRLFEASFPPERIVLCFHSPYMRKHMKFGLD